MRKPFSLALLLFLSLALIKPQSAQAEMPVKAKAFLTIAGYGTAGGALLGLATMAFGQSSRAVAQGASLGLYAGLLFGTYVLVSHHNKTVGSYDDTSPYRESNDVYGDEYNSEEGGAEEEGTTKRGGFFDRFQVMQDPSYLQNFTFQSEKKKNSMPPIHLNIIQYNF